MFFLHINSKLLERVKKRIFVWTKNNSLVSLIIRFSNVTDYEYPGPNWKKLKLIIRVTLISYLSMDWVHTFVRTCSRCRLELISLKIRDVQSFQKLTRFEISKILCLKSVFSKYIIILEVLTVSFKPYLAKLFHTTCKYPNPARVIQNTSSPSIFLIHLSLKNFHQISNGTANLNKCQKTS